MAEMNKQLSQRQEVNYSLTQRDANPNEYDTEQRGKAPTKASSFDRVVEDTLKAEIKR